LGAELAHGAALSAALSAAFFSKKFNDFTAKCGLSAAFIFF
jgi:hypothetical protein